MSSSDLPAARQTIQEEGHRQRSRVTGAEYADAALKAANEPGNFLKPWNDLVLEACWGTVWSRPGLDHRTRSMLNIAMLCALNRSSELAVHTRGALNNGVTEAEIQEILLQAAVYCGMPAGREGFKVAEQVIKDWKAEKGR